MGLLADQLMDPPPELIVNDCDPPPWKLKLVPLSPRVLPPVAVNVTDDAPEAVAKTVLLPMVDPKVSVTEAWPFEPVWIVVPQPTAAGPRARCGEAPHAAPPLMISPLPPGALKVTFTPEMPLPY